MEDKKYSLKELRARHGFTQSDMAVKLGVSLQTYNHWENNFGNVKTRCAKRVADILLVQVDDIFFE